MDAITSAIMKLLSSRTHLINNDVTSARLLIYDSIKGLNGLVMNLENIGVQATEATAPCSSQDLANAILPL